MDKEKNRRKIDPDDEKFLWLSFFIQYGGIAILLIIIWLLDKIT